MFQPDWATKRVPDDILKAYPSLPESCLVALTDAAGSRRHFSKEQIGKLSPADLVSKLSSKLSHVERVYALSIWSRCQLSKFSRLFATSLLSLSQSRIQRPKASKEISMLIISKRCATPRFGAPISQSSPPPRCSPCPLSSCSPIRREPR